MFTNSNHERHWCVHYIEEGRGEGGDEGCHHKKGARRSLSVKNMWDGEGVINREFSFKRWRSRSYKRSKERVSNRDCEK